MQAALFETAPAFASAPASASASAAVPAFVQRLWRLQGQARRRGREVEPLLVTPRFLARIDSAACPVTREALLPRSAQAVALRGDAAVAAGHLATLGPAAAEAAAGVGWQAAWATAQRLAATPGAIDRGLDAAAWRRLAVLLAFVQPVGAAEAATLPLHVLPPNRLRVLGAVQGLQVAMTLALRGADRAARLSRLAALAGDEDTRLALRLTALTLIARCPADLDTRTPLEARRSLEDLWDDPLLQRRWQRLALRLGDAGAQALLQRGRRAGLLGTGWRPLDARIAVDGWALTAPEAAPLASRDADRPAPPRLARPVLGAGRRRDDADAAAAAAAGAR